MVSKRRWWNHLRFNGNKTITTGGGGAIITNDLIDFYVNKERKVMKEGECWEINNKKIHAVENNSNEDRVHLLFDIIPNKFLIWIKIL